VTEALVLIAAGRLLGLASAREGSLQALAQALISSPDGPLPCLFNTANTNNKKIDLRCGSPSRAMSAAKSDSARLAARSVCTSGRPTGERPGGRLCVFPAALSAQASASKSSCCWNWPLRGLLVARGAQAIVSPKPPPATNTWTWGCSPIIWLRWRLRRPRSKLGKDRRPSRWHARDCAPDGKRYPA